MNMAMSADGKISTFEQRSVQFSSVEDRRVMDEIRAKADAIIIGANTLRTDGIHLWIKTPELIAQRRKAGKNPHPINIVVSQSLKFPTDCRFFTFPDTEKWVITTTEADPQRVHAVEKSAIVCTLAAPGGRLDIPTMLGFIKSQGIDTLLLEGGSHFNFQMIAHDAVDEIYLTVCPLIIGGQNVATPVGGRGFRLEEFRNLELLAVRHHQGELFLHYRVLHDRRGSFREYQSALGREAVFRDS